MVKYPKPLSSFFPTSSSSVLLVIFLILLLKSFWPLCSKGLCLNPSLQIIHFLFFSYTFITIILMKFQLLWLYFRDRFTQIHLSPDVWHGAICTYLVVTQLREVSMCVCLWRCLMWPLTMPSSLLLQSGAYENRPYAFLPFCNHKKIVFKPP